MCKRMLFSLLLIVAMASSCLTAAPLNVMSYDGAPRVLVSDPLQVLQPDAPRIERLTDGTLILVYSGADGPQDGAWTPEGVFFRPRDIFLKWSLDGGDSWSAPINLSNTANTTDSAALYDPDGLGPLVARPFYGTTGKPTIFTYGAQQIAVAWSSNWCGSGLHGPAAYAAYNGVEVPFACAYVARLGRDASGVSLIETDRLSDGRRDALDPVVRSSGAGWGVVWQEDPLGFQLGEGDGPGEGDSGAKVSAGTDIWYSDLASSAFAGAGNPWSVPVPISDNYDYVNGVAGATGASRPNLALVGSQAVVAYEESKGGTSTGKYVIYHVFPFTTPPTADAGTIISDPAENGRRVRFVAQSTPGTATGLRFFIFWRQGLLGQGGPADVVGRLGYVPVGTDLTAVPQAGLRPGDLYPAVDQTTPANSAMPLNLTSASLADATDVDSAEDARAHRAVMRGDALIFGYTYTHNQAMAAQAMDNYNVQVRRSTDGGVHWSAPVDLSRLPLTETAVEPRLMGTPATVAGSSDPGDKRDPDVLFAAWGVSLNQDTRLTATPVDLQVVATRSVDAGNSYEESVVLADGSVDGSLQNGGLQLRSNPAGDQLFLTWLHQGAEGYSIWYDHGKARRADANLSVSALAPSIRVQPGAAFSLGFRLGNQGHYDATTVTLSIQVPPDLSGWIQSVTLDGVSMVCMPVSTGFRCPLERIPVNANMTLMLHGVALTPIDDASITLLVQASDETDPALADNADSIVISATNADVTGGGGGCALNPGASSDPTLLTLLGIACVGVLLRRRTGNRIH